MTCPLLWCTAAIKIHLLYNCGQQLPPLPPEQPPPTKTSVLILAGITHSTPPINYHRSCFRRMAPPLPPLLFFCSLPSPGFERRTAPFPGAEDWGIPRRDKPSVIVCRKSAR